MNKPTMADLERDKQDWFAAWKIARLPTQRDRREALTLLAQDHGEDYAAEIERRARISYQNIKSRKWATPEQLKQEQQQ